MSDVIRIDKDIIKELTKLAEAKRMNVRVLAETILRIGLKDNVIEYGSKEKIEKREFEEDELFDYKSWECSCDFGVYLKDKRKVQCNAKPMRVNPRTGKSSGFKHGDKQIDPRLCDDCYNNLNFGFMGSYIQWKESLPKEGIDYPSKTPDGFITGENESKNIPRFPDGSVDYSRLKTKRELDEEKEWAERTKGLTPRQIENLKERMIREEYDRDLKLGLMELDRIRNLSKAERLEIVRKADRIIAQNHGQIYIEPNPKYSLFPETYVKLILPNGEPIWQQRANVRLMCPELLPERLPDDWRRKELI